jgi:HAD superfamily hydrolase (TIGR01490 family)
MQIAAFFDIDGTLTKERTWKGFIDYFRQHRLRRGTHLVFLAVHYPLYYFRRLGLISESRFRRPWAAHLAWYVRGMTISEAAAVWEYTVHSLEGSWQNDTREVLDKHLTAGDLVMLVSSGPLPIVKRIASELGVEHYVGTPLEIKCDHYTGRSLEPIVIDETKASAALGYLKDHQLSVDLLSSFAYADSTPDLSLLEMVGHPVAAHPDAGLKEIAERRGWTIMA